MLPAATLGDRLGPAPGVARRHQRCSPLASIAAALSTTSGGADRRPRGPGPRRRRDHAAVADPARRRGPAARCAPPRSASGAASPASGSRSARSSAAPSSRASAGRRSSGSTSRSPWSRCRCCCSRVDESQRRLAAARPASAPLLLGGAVFLGIWGIVHGNDDGWTSRGGAGRWSAAVCWCRRTSSTPAGRAARGAAAAAVPLARLLGRQRDRADLHARHVRRGVPARPVPPDRAGLHPARGRPPHPAVDRRADGGRPDRRGARAADRPAPAAGPGLLLQAARWCGWPCSPRPAPRTGRSCPAS